MARKRIPNPLQHLIETAPDPLPKSSAVLSSIFNQRMLQPRRWKQWTREKLDRYFPNGGKQPDEINMVMARLIYGLEYVGQKREGKATEKAVRNARAAWDIKGSSFDPDMKELLSFTSEKWQQQIAKEKAMATPKKDKTPSSKKEKTPRGPSNKEVIYLAWDQGAGESDPEKLLKKVKGAVKLTTIKSWMSMWGKGKGLPSCAGSAPAKPVKKAPVKKAPVKKAPVKKKTPTKKTPAKKKSPPRKKTKK